MKQAKFSFQRSRGIVWVCDLSNSTKSLNDPAIVSEMENFLPRLHWLGMIVVEAAGGVFLKWTGDGFLAWFETPLHREMSLKTLNVLEAIWQLTFTVNVTQLGTSASKKFRLRHGVAFEHDALLTTITDSTGRQSLDITGRAVVLAFRLSGISSEFPCLVVDETMAKAAKDSGYKHAHFKKWSPSPEELLRYFKGERWGTKGLAKSVKNGSRKRSLKSVVRASKEIISKVDSPEIEPLSPDSFHLRFTQAMLRGPQWAKGVLEEEASFVRNDLLGSLKELTKIVSERRAQ